MQKQKVETAALAAAKTTEIVAPEKQAELSRIDRFRSHLEKQKDDFKSIMYSKVPAEYFINVAVNSVRKQPRLLNATADSLMACIFSLAEMGLVPDTPSQQAWLIPRKGTAIDPATNRAREITECSIMIGYRGLLALAYRAGAQKITTGVVHEGDHFEVSFGFEEKINHIPALRSTTGTPVAVYAIVKWGGTYFFDVAPYEEVKKAAYSKTPAWDNHEEQMVRKSMLRRTLKMLPIGFNSQKDEELLEKGMAIDDSKYYKPALSNGAVLVEAQEVAYTVEDETSVAAEAEEVAE